MKEFRDGSGYTDEWARGDGRGVIHLDPVDRGFDGRGYCLTYGYGYTNGSGDGDGDGASYARGSPYRHDPQVTLTC